MVGFADVLLADVVEAKDIANSMYPIGRHPGFHFEQFDPVWVSSLYPIVRENTTKEVKGGYELLVEVSRSMHVAESGGDEDANCLPACRHSFMISGWQKSSQ